MSSGLHGSEVDTTIAADHMVLAATALGLGTCWIGAFEPAKVAKVIGLPEGVIPAHVVPLGYPAQSPPPRARKSLDQVVCQEVYA